MQADGWRQRLARRAGSCRRSRIATRVLRTHRAGVLAHLAREGSVERVDQERYALKRRGGVQRAVEKTLRELGAATRTVPRPSRLDAQVLIRYWSGRPAGNTSRREIPGSACLTEGQTLPTFS